MASNYPPKKNVAFTMGFFIHKNDGTIIANPTLTGSNVHTDLGTTEVTNSTLAVVDTTTGLCSIALAQAVMNGDQIDGTITSSSTGAVVYTFKLLTAANTQDELGTALTAVDDLLDTEVAALTAAIITNAAGADIAADIIALKTQADIIQADTDLLDDAAGGLADIHTDVAAVKAETALIFAGTVTNAAGADVAADVIALRAVADTIATDTTTDIPATITTMQGNVTSILEDTGATLDTLVKDIPTNAELATALGTADDATLAAIAALDVVVDTAAGNVLLALKLLRNKVVTDPAAGIMTVYDDNGVDVLYTANVYETAGTATPYAGNAINRKDRLA
jgi:hypothetical protein